VKSLLGRGAGAVGSIRVRLAGALFLALLPVLILGVLQSVFAFKAEADSRRQSLELAAGRSPALAPARLQAAGPPLPTPVPAPGGHDIPSHLDSVATAAPG